jgi:nucleoside-diphosphate-sugar epimerase
MKKKVLIIGGTGFLGFHTAKLFEKKKFKVISLSRTKPKKLRFLKNIKYVFCDISNKQKLFNILEKIKKIDFVINFGGEVEHRKINKTFLSHYNGLENLANYFKNRNLIKFIQIGSSLEYGKSVSPQNEKSKLNPKSNYSKAKAKSSRCLLNLYKKNNFPAVILRPYQVFGPYQDLNRFIPFIITGCLKNKRFECSDGSQFRDFIYVEDFVNYLYLLTVKNNINGEVFNIGSGKPIKLKKIINLIKKKIKMGTPQFGKIKLRKDENLVTYPDISKLKRCTKIKPKTEFLKGLKKTIKFYRENKI